MKIRTAIWIALPLLITAGVVWLGAQEKTGSNVQVLSLTELASRLELREKALGQKETALRELEQRLQTLQSTLDKDRQDLEAREKALKEAQAKLEAVQNRKEVDPQLVKTYEVMDPLAGAKAMKELAAVNMDVAVGLLGMMQPKKAGKLMDQLASEVDAKLAGQLSEKVGLTRKK